MIDEKFFLYVSVLKKIRDNRLFRATPELIDPSDNRFGETLVAELEQDYITESELQLKTSNQKAARFLLFMAHEVVLGKDAPIELQGKTFFNDLVGLVRAYHERPSPPEYIDPYLSGCAVHILKGERRENIS